VVCGKIEKIKANVAFWSKCLMRKKCRWKGKVRMGLGVWQNIKVG
jgi:hypothetical protein